MASEDGLRIAAHARRTGRFPMFTEDPVSQWATEEALAVRWERMGAEDVPAETTDDPATFAKTIQSQLAEAGV